MKLVIAAAVIAIAGTARAGSLADAIARHAPADVDALRAQLPGDPAIRCTLGAVYAKRDELPHAAVYLADCEDAKLPPEIGEPIAKLAIETRRRLRDSKLAVLEIVTKPAGMTAEIGALPGDQLVTPATIWIPAGTYDVTATHDGRKLTNHVTTTAHSRSVVFLEDSAPVQKPVKAGKADFTEDAEPSERHEGSPAAIKHDSLMSKKLRGIVDPAAGGSQLVDPLATSEEPPPAMPVNRIGLRIGSGVATNQSLAIAFALEGHRALTESFGLVGRVDYLAGENGYGGAAAGATAVIASPDTAFFSAGLALRGVRRTGDVERYGLGGDAMLELALRQAPVVLGARFEQGFTATRERAVVFELGFDLQP